MSQRFVLFALALAAALLMVATSQPGAQGTSGPARAKLRDFCAGVPPDCSLSDSHRIRSDGLGTYDMAGTYADGWDCVRASVSNGGGFGMRTLRYTCQTDLTHRAMTLDFSEPVGTNPCFRVPDPSDPSGLGLDTCGSNSSQDVRVLASKLFKSNATATGVDIYFSLKPKFTGTSAFKLEFEQAVPISPGGSNIRTMTAGLDAVAELYQLSGTNLKISLGRYKMPFQMTVTLCGVSPCPASS